jgi:hypothetical protein
MERIARGVTDRAQIVQGVDPNSAHVVELLLGALDDAMSAAAAANSQRFYSRHAVEFKRIRQVPFSSRTELYPLCTR